MRRPKLFCAKIIKKCTSAALCAALLFSLCGCFLFESKAETIYYDISSEPVNLDPQTASDKASLVVINNVFEGLYTLDDAGAPQKAIAEAYKQEGNKYIFSLRKDVLWENEEPVTANDFVFALRRLMMPETGSEGATRFYCIKNAKEIHEGELPEEALGVTAASDFTLQIELARPTEDLLSLLASTYAAPCNEDFFRSSKGKYGLDATKIISNGAFDVLSWKHGQSIKLNKSDTYYDNENVMPSGVNLYVKQTEESAERLKDGTISAAFIKREYIEPFQKKGYNISPIENATWGVLFGQNNPVLQNESIRQGIAKCFDRSSYSEYLSEEFSLATAAIPHSVLLFGKPFRTFAGEIAAPVFAPSDAIALMKNGMAELQIQKVEPLNMIINKDSSEGIEALFSYPSQIMQREISLYINAEELEGAEYQKRLLAGDFDLAFYELLTTDYSAASILSSFQTESSLNYGKYSNADFDEALTLAHTAAEQKGVTEAYVRAEKQLLENPAFLPMFYATDYFVESSDITGIYYNEATGLVNFKNAKPS